MLNSKQQEFGKVSNFGTCMFCLKFELNANVFISTGNYIRKKSYFCEKMNVDKFVNNRVLNKFSLIINLLKMT